MNISIKSIDNSLEFINYSKDKNIDFNNIDNIFGNPFFLNYHENIKCNYLLIELENKLVGYLPYTVKDGSIFSHGGATYGGFIQISDLQENELNCIFEDIKKFYSSSNLKKLVIRFLPDLFWNNHKSLNAFFHEKMITKFSEDEFYIPINNDLIDINSSGFRRNHKRDIKRFQEINSEIIQCESKEKVSAFHTLLTKNLEKHGVLPTHTLDELFWLKSNLSNKIKIHLLKDKEYFAGVTLFEINSSTDYIMYGSLNYENNIKGSLKYLYWKTAINSLNNNKHYLSLGINTKYDEPKNELLEKFKIGFGAKVVERHTKEISLV